MYSDSIASRKFWSKYKFSDLFSDTIIGALQGCIVIVICISFASLIFSEALHPYILQGISIVMVSSISLYLILALISSFPLAVSLTQDKPAILFGLIGAGITSELAAQGQSQALLPTFFLAVLITGFITSLILMLLGFFKLGNIVRFVPYPVIGGFLAGTGWLIIVGSFSVTTDHTIHLQNIMFFTSDKMLTLWVPGAVFGLILFFLQKKFSHPLLMPIMILIGIAAFYVSLKFMGISMATAKSKGFMLGPFPRGALLSIPTLKMFHGVDWHVIASQWGNILSIIILTPIAVLLNAGGLEVETRCDINFDKELNFTGLGNLIGVFLGGGAIGYQAFSLSALNYELGAKSRLVGVIGVICCVAVLFTGINIISVLPKFIFGGLLFYFGISLLYEWLFSKLGSFTKWEYLVILIIFTIIAVDNFLAGIAAGLVFSLFIFVMQYSRVKIIRRATSAALLHSNVERNLTIQTLISKEGDSAFIIQLQGYLFFGNTKTILDVANERMVSTEHLPLRYMILDFLEVQGADSSTANSFIKLYNICQEHTIKLILSGMSDHLLSAMKHHIDFNKYAFLFYRDLDHALESCETEIISAYEAHHEIDLSWVRQLEHIFPNKEDRVEISRYFTPLTLAENSRLFSQGDAANTLYFVESGILEIIHTNPDGKKHRISTVSKGTIIGEMAVYAKGIRSASVYVTEECKLYYIDKSNLEALKREHPVLAAQFHEFIAEQLTIRLLRANSVIQSLIYH